MLIDRAGRANNFDFLRLALAVLVIASHSYPLGTGTEVNEPLSRLTHGQITLGGVAVDWFFVMSGFLITASAERSANFRQFLSKRIARIYPAFLVCAAITLFVFMPLGSAYMAVSSTFKWINDVVLQALRLREFKYSGAFPSNPMPGVINGSVWSVQYEFWCYLGVACLAALKLLRRRYVVLLLFAATVVFGFWAELTVWHPGPSIAGSAFGLLDLWARLLPLYLAGVVCYLYRDRIPYSTAGVLAALASLVIASYFRGGWALVFPIAGAYMILYLAYVPQTRLQRFGRYGDVSYGTYLYAFPVQQLMVRSAGHPVAPWKLFLGATPITLILAAGSWYGVERHFLRPARRKESPVLSLESQ